MKHNGKIGFWKFVFSIIIIALHIKIYFNETGKFAFAGGSIVVEFFFIVSGYLFAKKCLNYKKVKSESIGDELILFIKNKLNQFLPYIFFMIIISIPLLIIFKNYNDYDFLNGFYCLFFFPLRSIVVSNVYGITWYIQAMIYTEFIFFPLLLKYGKKFIQIYSPLIILFLGGYIFVNHWALSAPWDMDNICYWGLLRAIFDMNVGMIIYLLTLSFSKIEFTTLSKVLITILETCGYLSVFYIMNLPDPHLRFDFFMVIIYSVCVMISFSNKAYLNNLFNNKFVYYLEKLSLPMYINQFLLIELFGELILKNNLSINFYYKLLIISIVSIAIGIIELKIIELYNKNSYKIKRIFVKC